MDVIALAQFEINNAVATLGTALTESHLQKIFRYTSEIVFCFDGDKAGRKAAARALETALPEMRDGVSAKFLFLPDGEDPDTMVRQLGKEAFMEQVDSALPLSEFLFEQLSDGIDDSTADGKARLSKVCAPQINRIPQGVFRQLMLEELSRRTGISAENLRDYVATHKPPQQYNAEPSSPQIHQPEPIGEEPPEIYGGVDYEPYPETITARSNKIRLSPVKFLTALLINHPQLAEYVEDTEILNVSADVDMALFLKILALINSDSQCIKTSHIFARMQSTQDDPQELQLLRTLAGSELHQPPKGTGRDDDQEFNDTLAHVMRDAFEALPGERKATFLLSQETLTERQIKQLLKIHMQLSDDSQNIELKNKIKQRLVV